MFKAFIAEGNDILERARDPSIEDALIESSLSDFHDRTLLYLLKTQGGVSAKRLHDHDGFRLFAGAYSAALSGERIRLIRHLETDLRRLHEFLTRAELRSQVDLDYDPLQDEDAEQEAA